jgi:hypothetical protein
MVMTGFVGSVCPWILLQYQELMVLMTTAHQDYDDGCGLCGVCDESLFPSVQILLVVPHNDSIQKTRFGPTSKETLMT